MGYDYSDSDDESRHRSKRKSKTKRYSRSRSASRDRDRVQKSKKSSKHKPRSRSRSITSEKRSRRRSHSRSIEKSRRRSRSVEKSRRRSRSSEYSSKQRGHRRSRSGSRSRRSRSHSQSDSRKSSRSRDSHKSFSSKPAEQITEAKNNNAQLAEKKLQKALKAAITADDILRAQGVHISSLQAKTSQLSFEEQKSRASAINDIESGDFVQEAFKSSRSEIPLPLGSSVDASHAGAMFSSGPSAKLSAPLNVRSHGACVLPSNANSIMHPNLYIGVEEKMEKWKQKVIELRRQKLTVS